MPSAISTAWSASLISPMKPGTTLTPAAARRFFDLDLVAHRRDRLGRRADEGDPPVGQRPREALALGQEAVARMHRLGAGRAAGVEDQLGVEVGSAAGGGPSRTPRRPSGRAARARRRRNRRRPSRSPSPRRADDAAGDLAPVRDQDLVEHLSSSARCDAIYSGGDEGSESSAGIPAARRSTHRATPPHATHAARRSGQVVTIRARSRQATDRPPATPPRRSARYPLRRTADGHRPFAGVVEGHRRRRVVRASSS